MRTVNKGECMADMADILLTKNKMTPDWESFCLYRGYEKIVVS